MTPRGPAIVPSIRTPAAACNSRRVRAIARSACTLALMKRRRGGCDGGRARPQPLLGGTERQAQEHPLPLLACARLDSLVVLLPPCAQFAAPDEEVAFVLQPALQGRPCLE